jgi:hypothetical protein
MCITVKHSQAKVLTATDDIVVYKVAHVGTKGLRSLYQRYPYSDTEVMVAEKFDESIQLVNDLYSGKLSYQDEEGGSERVTYLTHGFHSFTTFEHARELLRFIGGPLPETVEFVKNETTGKKQLMKVEERRVMRFVIPAGTRYVKGWFTNRENILSEMLKWNAVYKPKPVDND